MPSQAESVLFASLSDVDALEVIVKEGINLEVIPTEGVRPVVEWAMDRYFESGLVKAPSNEAIMEVWADRLSDNEMTLGDGTETDNIEWALDHLKAQYAHLRYQQFLKASGTAMAKADTPDKIDVLVQAANDLFSLALALETNQSAADARFGIADRLRAYEARSLESGVMKGMTFGLPEVDEHTFGIHDGELCVLAAGPKTGKSYYLAFVALHMWRQGKTVVLFTLENSVEMTLDRICCIAVGVDSRRWQRGKATEAEIQRVTQFADQMGLADNALHILKPKKSGRTPAAMVRQAQMLGADMVLVDQLTFVKHPDPANKPRHEIVGEIIEEFKNLISTGRKQMPMLLAHQINREGVKAARKAGFLEMEMLAEGAGVERGADWVFGLFQSPDARQVQQAMLQILAARREDTTAWELNWDISSGYVAVLREIEVDA